MEGGCSPPFPSFNVLPTVIMTTLLPSWWNEGEEELTTRRFSVSFHNLHSD